MANKSGNPNWKKGKPRPEKAGRRKGTPNKFTDLKQAYLDVFDKIEEKSKKDDKIKSFFKWASKNDRNQGMFYQMISKMLPANVAMDHSGKIDSKLTIETIHIKSKNEDNSK